MSKRKSNSPHKPVAARPGVAKPSVAKPALMSKREGSVADLASSDGAELQAVPETETRLLVRPGEETEARLAPVPPLELDAGPALHSDLAEPKPNAVPLPVEAGAEASELEHAAMGEDGTPGPLPKTDRPRRPLDGMEACQTLFMEMTRDNLDWAASFASIRSPFEILGVAATFAGRRIDMYGRFTRAVVDIAAAPDAKPR